MNFEDALRLHYGDNKRIRKVLDMPPSRRRARILKRMEKSAASAVGEPVKDWGAVDWASLLEIILKLLLMLLPLILEQTDAEIQH